MSEFIKKFIFNKQEFDLSNFSNEEKAIYRFVEEIYNSQNG